MKWPIHYACTKYLTLQKEWKCFYKQKVKIIISYNNTVLNISNIWKQYASLWHLNFYIMLCLYYMKYKK